MCAAISARPVRYIKLGRKGGWEKECLENGIIRLGFGTEKPSRFRLCQKRNWDKLKKSFVDEGEALREAARFTKEIRLFFEDDGTTLWITFHADRMYWGFLDPKPPEGHSDGVGIWRTVANGWRCEDLSGMVLSKELLSGDLTKLAGYPGTSCEVRVADDVIRRINGETTTQVGQTLALSSMPTLFPDEVEPNATYPEGATFRVSVNAYERNPKARRRCIEFHGTICCICGFDFGRAYGPVADGFIHVHHLRELSQIGAEYAVDPKKDLRPVCPNCHAVFHRRMPAFSVEEVKAFLKKRDNR